MNDKIVDRIAKLLALATSSNPHEAALAASRAQALMFRFNVTEDAARQHNAGKGGYVVKEQTIGGAANWLHTLYQHIAKYNFCKAFRSKGQATIVGEKHNIEIVGYLYEYCQREINRLAAVSAAECGGYYGYGMTKTKYINDFRNGAVHEVVRRLREQFEASKQSASNDEKGLVVVKDKLLAQAFSTLLPSTHLRSGKGSARSSNGYYDGKRAGRTMAINPGVGGSKNTAMIGR